MPVFTFEREVALFWLCKGNRGFTVVDVILHRRGFLKFGFRVVPKKGFLLLQILVKCFLKNTRPRIKVYDRFT